MERNKAEETALSHEITGLNKNISETHSTIKSEFPKYFQLTQQHNVDLKSIQNLLKTNEALISYLSADSGLFVWAISAKSSIFRPINLTSAGLKQKIKASHPNAM